MGIRWYGTVGEDGYAVVGRYRIEVDCHSLSIISSGRGNDYWLK
jgi:hypothetical protein